MVLSDGSWGYWFSLTIFLSLPLDYRPFIPLFSPLFSLFPQIAKTKKNSKSVQFEKVLGIKNEILPVNPL